MTHAPDPDDIFDAPVPGDGVRPLRWSAGALALLDQRLLPGAEQWLRCESAAAVAAAIRDMVVRGAPAIGIAAAYGVVLAALAGRDAPAGGSAALREAMDRLRAARPTAVNLCWAVDRMAAALARPTSDPVAVALAEARAIHREDIAANRHMGQLGADLVAAGGVLTHCNAGALATGGYGTALGVVRAAWSAGRTDTVFACETRPWLQGARLTAWELLRDGIPCTVIADSAAATLMRAGRVSTVIVGADRIAANGDVANKIGTYGLAILARHHGARFIVVAPVSTLDRATATGVDIPIECRDGRELHHAGGVAIAPEGAQTWNPVFDVTPAGLVDFLVTERGVLPRPDRAGIARLLDTF